MGVSLLVLTLYLKHKDELQSVDKQMHIVHTECIFLLSNVELVWLNIVFRK
jgi:hypothetical protein